MAKAIEGPLCLLEDWQGWGREKEDKEKREMGRKERGKGDRASGGLLRPMKA